MKDKKLLLFGNTEKQPILHEMCALLEGDSAQASKKAPICLHAFLSMAGQTGFYGNLWNVFLTQLHTFRGVRRGSSEGNGARFCAA